MVNNKLTFKIINLPNNKKVRIPSDIELRLPENSLSVDKQHFLLEISWDDKYFNKIPKEYLDFFKFVLPYLHARTTDVHTACSMGFLPEVFARHPNIDKFVVAVALALHDNGWNQMSMEEIAGSLGYKGLKLSDNALNPKEKHAVLGAKKAKEILEKYIFNPPLTKFQKDLICKAILYHDKPWELSGKEIPLEMQLICDLDHLWSFTHENFWQDTIRKGVTPKEYANNLKNDLEGYFLSIWGKQKAKSLLLERIAELKQLND